MIYYCHWDVIKKNSNKITQYHNVKPSLEGLVIIMSCAVSVINILIDASDNYLWKLKHEHQHLWLLAKFAIDYKNVCNKWGAKSHNSYNECRNVLRKNTQKINYSYHQRTWHKRTKSHCIFLWPLNK